MMNASEVKTALKAAKFQLEIVAAELVNNGVQLQDISIAPISNFKRSFRGEIDEVSLSFDEIKDRRQVSIRVHRDGLYDRLPEGLFHQPNGHSRVSTAGEMKEEHKRYKVEEAAARKFFVPLESAFMQFGVLVSVVEQQQYISMLSGNLGNHWLRYWDIPEGIPHEMASRMLSLIPWAWRIAGSPKLSGLALSLILGKPVEVVTQWQHTHKANMPPAKLGQAELGNNAILGDAYFDPWPQWKFVISDLSVNERAQFSNGQLLDTLLKRFEELFTPLQIDIIFDFLPDQAQSQFQEEILGVGFVI